MFGLGAGYLAGGTAVGVVAIAGFIYLFKYGIDASIKDFEKPIEPGLSDDGELRREFDERMDRARGIINKRGERGASATITETHKEVRTTEVSRSGNL
ncbi:hypothetical protein [Candidatus Mycoplasma haematohominis]|uniref:hypothetical protein n=1 Tax=Candidatus Mycoplasma haematohominis TaxID=1494318 RepID=UPI001C0A6E8D|nr:hypothetical protein [Candidatus Mycoplasma haemohominis]